MNATRCSCRPSLLAPIALLGLLLTGCGGGGAGSTPGGIDEGELTVEAFGYDDPHPEGFHPLGKGDVATVVSRDETYHFWGGAPALAGLGIGIDDALADWDELDMPGALLPSEVLVAAAAGDPDGDSTPEMLFVVHDSARRVVSVRVVEPSGSGPRPAIEVPVPPVVLAQRLGAQVALGDLDGDGRDEFVLTIWVTGGVESKLRVFDDFEAGASLLLERDLENLPGSVEGKFDVACLQLDDDAPLELVCSGIAGAGVVFYDDLERGLAPLHSAGTPSGFLPARLVAGDYDGDGRDEVVVWWQTLPVSGRVDSLVELVQDAVEGFEHDPVQGQGLATTLETALLAGVAADVDADGVDELACVTQRGTIRTVFVDFFQGFTLVASPWSGTIALSAGDRDADLKAEIDYVRIEGRSCRFGTFELHEGGRAGVVVQEEILAWPFGEAPPNLISVTADFDDDGSRVRYTGNKELRLGPVVPIVLVAAPPTKGGISQNYGDTGASYGISQSTESAYTVETGVSVTLSAGIAVESPFGLFGASAGVSVENALARSATTATTVEVSRNFLVGHDRDYVVFQGTLYHSYEYEILAASDPAAIGTRMTLDVPVATRVYKWTLDFFNAKVAPEERLEPSLLGHTIGDPASYPTRAMAAALALAPDSYRTDAITTPQGSAPNEIGFTVTEATAQGKQLSYTVTHESGVTIGGATLGRSVGVTRDYLWSVSLSDSASFSCSIGGIADPGEWSDWNYDTGIVVHTLARPGRPTHHVLQFWTGLLGAGYGN